MRLRSLIFLISLVFFMLTAFSQGVANNISSNAGNETSSGAVNGTPQQPWDEKLFAFSAFLLLVLFAAVPLLINNILAHQHLSETQKTIDGFISKHADKMDEGKLVQIIHELIEADPSGAPGTARGIMALTITLIVGVALFFLVSYPPGEPANTSIKEVLLTLTGALTAIIGFYFGGKGAEIKPAESKATGATEPVAKVSEAKVPKTKLYNIKEDFIYNDKQYNKSQTMDLADIPDDILKDWVETKKIEPYVGKQEDVHKELEGKPGWYSIKADFHYQDNPYFKGNIMNLTDVPASILAEWKNNKWVEPYAGP
jgi:hypothetical protein